MQINKVFISAFLFSFLFHFLIFSLFCFYVDGRYSPLIYSWLNILDKNDLKNYKVVNEVVELSSSVNFGKKYFVDIFKKDIFYRPITQKDKYVVDVIVQSALPKKYEIKETNFFYLWERLPFFSFSKDETVSFKAFVSPYGKIVFLFPEKLSSNTPDTITTQEYVKEAAIFVNNKFFWTKLKILIK